MAASAFLEMIRLGLTHNGLIRFLATDSIIERNQLIGTAYLIGLFLAILLALILTVIYNFTFPTISSFGAYQLFLFWYPLFSVVTFPLKNAITLFQADLRFGSILIYRVINILPLSIFLVGSIATSKQESINSVMMVMVASSGILSLITIFFRQDGSNQVKNFDKLSFIKLFQFGKFNALTLLGTNLLQSIDLFLIGLSSLGPVAVAVYSIPLKFIELMQMPLRSLAAAAYPMMARFAEKKDWDNLKKLLYSRGGFLFICFVPICLILIILAPWFIKILAGESFYENNGMISSRLLIMFALVALFMPFDKFSGTALDAMNRPQLNTLKVLLMLFINIIIDVIALWWFSELQIMVLGSIVYTIVGGLIGFFFLKDKVKFSLLEFLKDGFFAINILIYTLRIRKK